MAESNGGAKEDKTGKLLFPLDLMTTMHVLTLIVVMDTFCNHYNNLGHPATGKLYRIFESKYFFHTPAFKVVT